MKMKKLIFAGLILALVLFSHGRVYAWGSTWMGILLGQTVNSARGMAGAFRYNAALQVDKAGYDSDIYYGMLGSSVPDFTLAVGPDLEVFLPLKQRVVFAIFESPRYLYYLKTDRERTLNNVFTGDMHIVFDRLCFRVSGGLVDAKQPLSSPELYMNVRLKEDDFSGLVLWQASRATSLTLQYQRLRYNYENLTGGFPSISDSLNRTESLVNFLAYLQPHSRARFHLEGQYSSYVFTKDVSRFKDSRSYGVYAGVEFLPPPGGYEGQTSGIQGSIRLGYYYLDVLDPSRKDYSGPSGRISISLGILKLTALRLYFSRGPQFSVHSGQTYYIQTAYGGGLSRYLARHVLFTYDFSYSRVDYAEGGVTDGTPLASLAIRYTTHALRLSYQMRKDFEISLLADLGRRNPQFAPRRAFIGFSLTYGYTAGRISLPTAAFF